MTYLGKPRLLVRECDKAGDRSPERLGSTAAVLDWDGGPLWRT